MAMNTPFGEWLPDQPDNTSGVTTAKNVIPAARGYRGLQDLSQYSNAADNRLRGIFAAKDDSGDPKIFAGDVTKLYEFTKSNSNLTNISKAGNYTSLGNEDIWKFIDFSGFVIGASGHNNILQVYDNGTSSTFADISGSPAAKHIAVVGDFVFTGNVKYGGTAYPNRVYFSSLASHTGWTIGTDQSDIQDIFDMGDITGIVGGEYATILCERGIVRGSYVGTPLIFQFDKVQTGFGCNYPNSVANVGETVFYLSDDGFYQFDGQRSTPIGAEKVNRFFFDDFTIRNKGRISTAVDPTEQIVVWSYTSGSSNDDTPDRLLIYNYALQRWSYAELDCELISPFMTINYTLEELDAISTSLDSLPASLDSSIYIGGQFIFGGAKDKKLHTFSGINKEALIETADLDTSNGRTSVITNVIPYVEIVDGTTPSITAQVSSRLRQVDQDSFGTASSLNADGYCNVRSNQGRYHKIRLNVSGTWKYIQGVEIEAKTTGKR